MPVSPGSPPPFSSQQENSRHLSMRFNYSNSFGMPSGGWCGRGDRGFGLFGRAGGTGLGGSAGVSG